MQFDLTGQTALVTGGHVGIGRSIAQTLAEHGADVAVTYMSHADSDVTDRIEAAGRRAMSLQVDATDSAAVDKVVGDVGAEFGHIDILINNAGGLVARKTLGETTDDHWRHVMDLNLASAMYFSRAVLPWMTSDSGRIVNVSSLAAQNGGGAGSSAYATSKAGMIGLTRALAKELAPKVTVNAVAPGLILKTPFHETFTPEADQLATIKVIPVQRAGEPDDVAAAVLFLAAPSASFTTGEVIDINGGTFFT